VPINVLFRLICLPFLVSYPIVHGDVRVLLKQFELFVQRPDGSPGVGLSWCVHRASLESLPNRSILRVGRLCICRRADPAKSPFFG
jgi:hypothetical protein